VVVKMLLNKGANVNSQADLSTSELSPQLAQLGLIG
jgi:hypothetical protein